MEPGIKFVVYDWEEFDFEIEIFCSNGLYSGYTFVYTDDSFFKNIHETLSGFPVKIGDERTLILVTMNPEFAGGGINFRFICSPPLGHSSVEIQIQRGIINKRRADNYFALFTLSIEAAAIDDFTDQLKSFEPKRGDSIFMRGLLSSTPYMNYW